MRINKIYAVEIAGACNLERVCTWCPMHTKPRNRPRGIMKEETFRQALKWVERNPIESLALHVFGEPLMHPKFDEYAAEFAKLTKVNVSTNGVLLDERWADRLAKIPWDHISVSPWDAKAKDRAVTLLMDRGIKVCLPQGASHDWAGQAQTGPDSLTLSIGCPFLIEHKAVIWWNGKLASCCITDREQDYLGDIFEDFDKPQMRSYDICVNCHHGRMG